MEDNEQTDQALSDEQRARIRIYVNVIISLILGISAFLLAWLVIGAGIGTALLIGALFAWNFILAGLSDVQGTGHYQVGGLVLAVIALLVVGGSAFFYSPDQAAWIMFGLFAWNFIFAGLRHDVQVTGHFRGGGLVLAVIALLVVGGIAFFYTPIQAAWIIFGLGALYEAGYLFKRNGKRTRPDQQVVSAPEGGLLRQQDEVASTGPDPLTTTPPANWYPDPDGSPQLRYWDGEKWTDHVRPRSWE